jgi:hypothetical protein
MVTKYVGVHCARCKRFMRQRGHDGSYITYEVESPEFIGVECDISSLTNLTCPHCGDVRAYSQEDVAHSTSPEGTDPQYPHRGVTLTDT